MNVKMYVITHKRYSEVKSAIYNTLHVGRALSDDLGYEGDDTGDNISLKNKNYCELTGLYYIWKNVKCDIVGICHYRRFFVEKEDFISEDTIKKLLENNDIIIPSSHMVIEDNVREQYAGHHMRKDWDVMRDIIRENSPEYMMAFDCMENTCYINPYNMMITRKEVFDQYCSWLFPLLFKLEEKVNIDDYDQYQARIFGFVSERLFRVWLLNQSLKVCEHEVKMVDTENCYNHILKRDLISKYVKGVLNDLTDDYANGNRVDVVDNSPLEVEFKGKMPIWVCWFQGYDEAPDIVKRCIESLDKNVDEDRAIIYLITLDNIGEFLTLPQYIIDKYAEGKISLTHLSDIIRMGLLYRYGGLWVDATYYVSGRFDEKFYDINSFYTIKTGINLYKDDITEGRWSGNFLKGASGNILFQYMLNAFYVYWRVEDELVDYFLIDYIIKVAYESIPEIKRMIDECPYSQENVFELSKILDRIYRKDEYEKLTANTNLFKLTYKKEYRINNLIGEKTYYGQILSEEL